MLRHTVCSVAEGGMKKSKKEAENRVSCVNENTPRVLASVSEQ